MKKTLRLKKHEVVKDDKYEGMWRVRSPDGTLSDMFNKTRAKELCFLLSAPVEGP
jgi:hypothetical protein